MKVMTEYWLKIVPFVLISLLVISCDDGSEDEDTSEGEESISYVVSISADQLSLIEGTDQGAEITVSLSQENETGSSITIDYTFSGSAESETDFSELSGDISIPNGAQSVTFDLILVDDDIEESEETLEISISSTGLADNVTLGSSQSIEFTISDDDETSSTYEVSISTSQLSLTEGTDTSVEIIVSLDQENETGSAISVMYDLSGSAVSGDDFSELSGDISIPNGAQSVTFDLTLVDDDIEESEETLEISLSSTGLADNVTLGSSQSVEFTISDDDETSSTANNDISVLVSKFYHTDALTVTFDDTWVTITTKDLPDHKSMYYATDNDLYEDYTEPDNPDFKKNPGEIEEQNIVFKIPRYPTEATNKQSPGGGAMGVAINSVVFFNQEAAPGDDILEELNTFDQYEGHPAGDTYHYHIEPIWLTELKGNDAFMGFLLDGFPVYGTHEDGAEITNDDLDDYHGHFGSTDDFPDGIYHYHMTEDLPWINGDAYYGTPGTRTE